jgi:di/tricarboxylate transporter
MQRLFRRNLVEAIILCVFVGAIAAALGYSPRARLVPLTIAVIGALLTLGQIVLQNLRTDEDLHVDLLAILTAKKGEAGAAAPPQAVVASSPQSERKTPSLRRELTAFGLIGLLLVLFVLLGPIPAIFLFIAGFFIGTGQYPAFKAIPIALGCTALIYVIFAFGLDVQFSPGLIDLSFGRL